MPEERKTRTTKDEAEERVTKSPSSTSGSELEGDRPQTKEGYEDAGQVQAREANERQAERE